MASTYSTSLKIQLIGTGEQSGVWGNTTNTNWNLIEQAVAGVQNITMVNADYTLTDLNGVSDEARNAVLSVGGTNSAIRKIVIPAVTKTYVVYNNTSGGYAITVGTSGGSVVTIPNGVATIIFCDATNTFAGISGSTGNFSVNGNETVAGNATIGGTLSVTGATSLSTGSISGIMTAPTATAGTSTTQLATTAFVGTAITNQNLGSMATQNANNVAITGGSIAGASISGLASALPVASGGTGATTLASNNVILGNGTSSVQTVAPGTSGNVLKSNGSTWVSGAGFGWNVNYANTTVSEGSTWSVPSNCIEVSGYITTRFGSNTGGLARLTIRNSSNSTLGTTFAGLTSGNDGGGGFDGYFPISIPLSSSANNIYVTRESGGNAISFVITSYVTSS